MKMIARNALALVAATAAAWLCAPAHAMGIAAQDIKILKSAEEPRVMVQYSGARAARIEIRINGVFAGQRVVDATRSSGEAAFTLDVNLLNEGENVVEAILLNSKGDVIGRERLVLQAERANEAVYIALPKQNETVRGTVEIRVGFGRQMHDAFVSFFVDGQFRSMKNFPPYSYIWDTRKETNGWHELEAWVYDRSQTTMKSQKTRVFVDNPGGRTERLVNPPADPTAPPVTSAVEPGTGLKTAAGGIEGVKGALEPIELRGLTDPNLKAPVSSTQGMKARDTLYAEASGIRVTDPKAPVGVVAPVEGTTPPAVNVDSNVVPVVVGTRLPDGVYTITYAGEVVRFDVEPFVEEGVPLTPLRHLFEHAGAEVSWAHADKVAMAKGEGVPEVWVKIGDLIARIDGRAVQLERPAFIKRGRTIIPLSFVRDALQVEVNYDRSTGHVLITKPSEKK
jgi:hypothetical protein